MGRGEKSCTLEESLRLFRFVPDIRLVTNSCGFGQRRECTTNIRYQFKALLSHVHICNEEKKYQQAIVRFENDAWT